MILCATEVYPVWVSLWHTIRHRDRAGIINSYPDQIDIGNSHKMAVDKPR